MITAKLSPTAFVNNENCLTNNFGLGNKMFKVAAGLGLAKKHGVKAVFPDLYHKNHKDFSETVFRNLDHNMGDDSFITSSFKWYRSGFCEIPYTKPGLNLLGDFQSWKFFDFMRSEIVEALGPDEKTMSQIENSEYHHLVKKKNTTAIHVRRGDYVKHPDQYKLVDIDYVKKSQLEFKGQQFIIFSDDIQWCKKNINFNSDDVFVESQTEIFDLYLMSMMKNQIISNSTFSWWAAYLNTNKNKKVISPSEWYGKTLKKSGYYTDEELIKKEWIVI